MSASTWTVTVSGGHLLAAIVGALTFVAIGLTWRANQKPRSGGYLSGLDALPEVLGILACGVAVIALCAGWFLARWLA